MIFVGEEHSLKIKCEKDHPQNEETHEHLNEQVTTIKSETTDEEKYAWPIKWHVASVHHNQPKTVKQEDMHHHSGQIKIKSHQELIICNYEGVYIHQSANRSQNDAH